MLEERVAKRFAQPALGALLGLGVAFVYWLLDDWMSPAGSGLADCAAWFGGLGFVGGILAAFESEGRIELE